MKISCIGSGVMGTALMKGAVSAAFIDASDITFSDIDQVKAKAAAASLGGQVCVSNTEAVRSADYVFLAVKPQILEKVLHEVAPAVKEKLEGEKGPERLTLVSMAPGWTIKKIQTVLGFDAPVVRIMPNTPALVSRGVIAVAPSPEVSTERISQLETILSGAGLVDKVDENYLNAVTGLSGSGPAFVHFHRSIG